MATASVNPTTVTSEGIINSANLQYGSPNASYDVNLRTSSGSFLRVYTTVKSDALGNITFGPFNVASMKGTSNLTPVPNGNYLIAFFNNKTNKVDASAALNVGSTPPPPTVTPTIQIKNVNDNGVPQPGLVFATSYRQNGATSWIPIGNVTLDSTGSGQISGPSLDATKTWDFLASYPGNPAATPPVDGLNFTNLNHDFNKPPITASVDLSAGVAVQVSQ